MHAVRPEHDEELTFEPLPKPRRGRSEREFDRRFVDHLMSAPGEWSVYDVHERRQLAQNDRARILGFKRAWAAGNFEVATRKTTDATPMWRVYVRYVGD